MPRVTFLIMLCMTNMSVYAKEYGHYAIQDIIGVSENSNGQHFASLDAHFFDAILSDLELHAGSFPPHFDSSSDRSRAEQDVSQIVHLLEPLSDRISDNPEVLLRLGLLSSIGHNLDLPGSGERAALAFAKLVALRPNDPNANYQYGVFLAGSTKVANAIPFLEKAKSLGVVSADYPLGIAYATLGNKTKALDNLDSYAKRVPTDANAAKLIDAVRAGNIQNKQVEP